MNRAPFEAFPVDVPALMRILGTPAAMERAGAGAGGALEALEAVPRSLDEALGEVRGTLRHSEPPLDKDVVVRMEGLLQDAQLA
jgi:hypothetical protein